MKPIALRLSAFGPYAGSESVDFEALRAAGLFVVSGPTGVGKSSIFDALCYALYGLLPGSRRGGKSIRSDHADSDQPCEVSLDFRAKGELWRVTRRPSFERMKKRGGGSTTAAPETTIARRIDDEWVGVASKQRDVDDRCKELLGLDFEQFQRVVLLPQGGFSQVLNSKSEDRQELLRTLFATEHIDTAVAVLKEQARTASIDSKAQQSLSEDRVRQAAVSLHDSMASAAIASEIAEPISVAVIEDSITSLLLPRLEAMQLELVTLSKASHNARDLVAAAQDLVKKQERFAALNLQLASYRELTEVMEGRARRSSEARLANPLVSFVTASKASQRLLEESINAVSSKRILLEAALPGISLPTELTGEVLMNLSLKCEENKKQYTSLLDSQLELARKLEAQNNVATQLRGDAAQLESIEAELAGLKQTQSMLTTKIREVQLVADGLEDAERKQQDLQTVSARLTVLLDTQAEIAIAQSTLVQLESIHRQRVGEKTTELAVLDDEILLAADEVAVAERSYEEMLQSFILSTAPRLAAQLVKGEPCLVCGSIEHPQPANDGSTPISDLSDVQRSHERLNEVRQRLETTRADRSSIAEELARLDQVGEEQQAATNTLVELRSKAQSLSHEMCDQALLSIAQMKQLLAEAAESVAIGKTAQEQMSICNKDLELLNLQIPEVTERSITLRSQLDARKHALNESAEALDEALAALALELGGKDPQEQLAVAEQISSLVANLSRLVEERSSQSASAIATSAALKEAISSSPFESAEQILLATMPDDELTELEEAHQNWLNQLAETEILQKQLAQEAFSVEIPDLEKLRTAADAATKEQDHKANALAATDAHLLTVRKNLEALSKIALSIVEAQSRAEQLKHVADVCAGNNKNRVSLEAWVLGAYLREVVAQANLHLGPMSSGRYSLAVAETTADRRSNAGLDLEVEDAHTGRSRSASSLSGGETFQASLSLALGLADVVTSDRSGFELDCIFIDEGFGALDADALDLAIGVLDGLRSRGSLVGVITHVAALKEALQLGIEVKPLSNGAGSTLRQLI